MHVVRQMVDVGQAMAFRIGKRARNSDKIDIVDADVANRAERNSFFAILAAPAVNEINQRIADALDRWNIQFHRTSLVVETPRAQFQRALVSVCRIVDTKRDRANRRTMLARKALRK